MKKFDLNIAGMIISYEENQEKNKKDKKANNLMKECKYINDEINILIDAMKILKERKKERKKGRVGSWSWTAPSVKSINVGFIDGSSFNYKFDICFGDGNEYGMQIYHILVAMRNYIIKILKSKYDIKITLKKMKKKEELPPKPLI